MATGKIPTVEKSAIVNPLCYVYEEHEVIVRLLQLLSSMVNLGSVFHVVWHWNWNLLKKLI